jgi:hypothetical protein
MQSASACLLWGAVAEAALLAPQINLASQFARITESIKAKNLGAAPVSELVLCQALAPGAVLSFYKARLTARCGPANSQLAACRQPPQAAFTDQTLAAYMLHACACPCIVPVGGQVVDAGTKAELKVRLGSRSRL